MKETLITFKTACLAKLVGFDISVNNWFNTTEPDRVCTAGEFNWNYKSHGDIYVSAPTQSLLQKWLREVHGLHINQPYLDQVVLYGAEITNIHTNEVLEEVWQDMTNRDPYLGYSFEEALEAGLLKALEIVNKVRKT